MKKKIICIAASMTIGFLIAQIKYEDIDWAYIAPIATTIGAIITLVALGFTIYFSSQNRNMIIDERKAHLIFTIKIVHNNYVLMVKNTGKSNATKVKFRINDKFLSLFVGVGNIKDHFENNEKYPFTLPAGDEKIYRILPLECEYEQVKRDFLGIDINITGSYTESYESKEITIDEKFNVRDFIGVAAIPPDLILNRVTEIKQYVEQINKTITPDDTTTTK